MTFNSPDIETFKNNLENSIEAVKRHKLDSHSAIKIQSLLNLTVYVMATRFLEASVKHIVYNCCIMRGDSRPQLESLVVELKSFNNPKYSNIKEIFQNKLSLDITMGIREGFYGHSDITGLDQIVNNRHRNVHASTDSAEWYNSNTKDIEDFNKEYIGLLNILKFLDSLVFDTTTRAFRMCK